MDCCSTKTAQNSSTTTLARLLPAAWRRFAQSFDLRRAQDFVAKPLLGICLQMQKLRRQDERLPYGQEGRWRAIARS